ncbi:UNVERIFIED_CONTAM: Tubby-like protein 8 [Sesamum angustifolium]|uniref:Tubby-like protein 8 n=1 Tax=Sesamum angustifolium TaxID=2727405 RepID=A0AAW2LI43_9LAMI
MAGCKKTTISRQSSYTSTYRNPLIEQKHHRGSSDGGGNSVSLGAHMLRNLAVISDDKENAEPNVKPGKQYSNGKENEVPDDAKRTILKEFSGGTTTQMKENLLKPSSLQLCIKKNEPDSSIGLKIWDSIDSEKSNSANVWDYSDSEAAPASSWSALPNRALLYRPLPVDVGRCTCIIVKETSPDGFDGGTLYTLYTNEGKGRQNRKLAVAYHRRRRGRSEFTIAQNAKGIMARSEDSLIGIVTANLVGSKYHIWDQGHCLNSRTKRPKLLAAVKEFKCNYIKSQGSGSVLSIFRRQKPLIQHINGLPAEWEGSKDKVHKLFSKVPSYNKFSKRYELDFRDRGRAGLKIQSSVKNFQLTLERNGKQTILQLGRLGKSKYVMDYRYSLAGRRVCIHVIKPSACVWLRSIQNSAAQYKSSLQGRSHDPPNMSLLVVPLPFP